MGDAGHDKLKPLEGTFRAQVRIWMGADEPSVSTGTMVAPARAGRQNLRTGAGKSRGRVES